MSTHPTVNRLFRFTFTVALCLVVVWFLVFRVPKMPRIVHALRFIFDILPDVAAIFLALVLAAIGIALFFLPEEVKQLESRRKVRLWLAASLMGLALIFGVGGVISDSVQKREDKEAWQAERRESRRTQDKLTEMLRESLELQRLATTNLELQRAQLNTLANQSIPQLAGSVKRIGKPVEEPKPDVTLRFVNPKDPFLVLVNLSDSIARDMKWTVAVWNMDLPDRNDPLPIPVSVFDWLGPRAKSGPENLFDSPTVAPLLKPGNRLFGSASVICPTCKRGRTFIVYIVFGEGGWFSEIKAETSGNVFVPTNFLKETRESYFRQIESLVTGGSRIPIGTE